MTELKLNEVVHIDDLAVDGEFDPSQQNTRYNELWLEVLDGETFLVVLNPEYDKYDIVGLAKHFNVTLVDPQSLPNQWDYGDQVRFACVAAADQDESSMAAVAGHLMKTVDERYLPLHYLRMARLVADECG